MVGGLSLPITLSISAWTLPESRRDKELEDHLITRSSWYVLKEDWLHEIVGHCVRTGEELETETETRHEGIFQLISDSV